MHRLSRDVCLVLAVSALASVAACRRPANRFRIVDVSQPDAPGNLFEDFSDGYFAAESDGNVQIILQRVSPSESDPRQLISQSVLLDTAYRPIPGKGVVASTMINATIHYVIATGPDAVCYRGAGFVTIRTSRDGQTLTGKLESGRLEPAHTAGAPVYPFGRALMTGEFRAHKDPRRLARLIRELPLAP